MSPDTGVVVGGTDPRGTCLCFRKTNLRRIVSGWEGSLWPQLSPCQLNSTGTLCRPSGLCGQVTLRAAH